MPPKSRAKQVWTASKKVLSKTIDCQQQLTTWLLPFILTTPIQTSFVVKAGNKSYGLAGSTTSDTGSTVSGGLSEIALKRKYRCG